MSDPIPVRINSSPHRFEATLDGHTAFLSYQRKSDSIILIHTQVPSALAGRGVAGELVRTALDYARREGLSVIPQCSFAASFIERHPEYGDLVQRT
jgi:predicted GNAT family acetyltransferase